MKKLTLIMITIVLSLSLLACTNREVGTIGGAAIGAGVVGAATGSTVGAVGGAVAGGLIGNAVTR